MNVIHSVHETVTQGAVQVGFTAEVPELVNMPYTMQANYDLSQIRGHVRVFGAGGEDHLVVNSRAANGPAATGALRTLDIKSADFEFNEAVLGEIKHQTPRPVYAGREESASTATGSIKRHMKEQAALIDKALTIS